ASELVDKINAGEIDSLIIVGENPAFTSAGDVALGDAIGKVENTVYFGEYDDETAVLCDWSVPVAHPLESWGDVVSPQGFYGVSQPQILPLLDGKTKEELLAILLDEEEQTGEQIVRRTADSLGSALSNRQWRQLLHDGFSEDFVVGEVFSEVTGDPPELPSESPVAVEKADQDDIEVIFQPAEGLYDGRFANNGWLQELPQSITKLTWDNAALMSPSTAETLKVAHGQKVALRLQDGSLVELPVYELPGCAPGVVTTSIGYGRERAGMVGGHVAEDVDAVGVNVAPIRTTGSMLVAYKIEARPRYTEYKLATTQDHWAIDELGQQETEKRSYNLVREGTPELLEKLPEFVDAKAPHVPHVGSDGSLWEEPINIIEEEKPKVPQWAMSIDLTKCFGCNACVIACQSENNIPIVGKEQVLNSREMHWLRIDRYFQGDPEFADVVQEPVSCMHCETAPCEQVCPVAATVHTDEGINAMAYNRCIGTRYCANNCPFKVRRFNYFNYNEDVGTGYGINAFAGNIEDANRKLQALVLNPDVSVRGRGVMEKCTYCVQRIEAAKIEARKDGGRPILDGDIVTACQSACPGDAIAFGNIADPDSKVSKARANVRTFALLEQLNLKPRTTFMARIRNTPAILMTSHQLEDIATLKAPHHGGGHDSHDSHDEAGHDDHDAHDSEGDHAKEDAHSA
ncbi:MAG: 4Fe-4S dicluster domain-containing protein, partial [Planctomycetota bacterium]